MKWCKVLHHPRVSEIENDRSCRLSVCPVTYWTDISMPVVAAGIIWLWDPKIRGDDDDRDARWPHGGGGNTPVYTSLITSGKNLQIVQNKFCRRATDAPWRFLVRESRTHPCARAHGRPIMGFSPPTPPLSHGENYKKKKGKSCQFECSGRRRNPETRGSSPPQRVKPVQYNVDGVSFRTISCGRVSVLHSGCAVIYRSLMWSSKNENNKRLGTIKTKQQKHLFRSRVKMETTPCIVRSFNVKNVYVVGRMPLGAYSPLSLWGRLEFAAREAV
ncbi:hypothetical protein EVAR_56598_1 [Eumeta japonica]|uniref:Uncharacterized protein n=1 Tax=Eumeta variegata TaxID=151549 RepID=A0A4C1Z0A8_EUMVA|nr:hypothetical protein EVAR_56598_1 [Eumeta japonica]